MKYLEVYGCFAYHKPSEENTCLPTAEHVAQVGSTMLAINPCTDVASHLLAIDLRLDVQIARDGLQQTFQHAEYFTCDSLITQPIFIQSFRDFIIVLRIS